FLIGIVEVPAAKPGVEVILERWITRRAGILQRLAGLDPFAVATIRDAGLGTAVPDVAACRPGDGVFLSLRRIEIQLLRPASSSAIGQRPDLLDEIGAVSAHRPLMAIGRHFAIAVEIVQQHELTDQLVMVGSNLFWEETKVRIAVAFLDVAEN